MRTLTELLIAEFRKDVENSNLCNEAKGPDSIPVDPGVAVAQAGPFLDFMNRYLSTYYVVRSEVAHEDHVVHFNNGEACRLTSTTQQPQMARDLQVENGSIGIGES